MLYFFRLFLILININQETMLNWFGIENSNTQDIRKAMEQEDQLNLSNVEPSFETIRLIIQGLWDKIQNGLTLGDIENVLFFILFIRFVILSLRYNLKTSFYITSIGLFAGFLWYRHLIDIISMYRFVLFKLPFFQKLDSNAFALDSFDSLDSLDSLDSFDSLNSLNSVQNKISLDEEDDPPHWTNPGYVLVYAIKNGIIDGNLDNQETKYYIDPISMFVSNLEEPTKSKIFPIYYKLYNKIIPKIYDITSKFWNELSGVAAYALIARVGKKYCPYLVRWHWTFLVIISMIEQIFMSFIDRVDYFESFMIAPQLKLYSSPIDLKLILTSNVLNGMIVSIVATHIGFILFGLFHAICGQYFYIPFFVENTELHIGPRPKNSIYSGGNTAWQDTEKKKKGFKRRFSKLWYGWFGSGTGSNWKFSLNLKKFIKKFIKKIIKKFKR